MLEAKVEDTIKARVDKVWAILGNFEGISPGPGIEAVDFEGKGVGMTRKITTANGPIIEELTAYDDGLHQLTYAIINEDSPLPFSNYSATIALTDNGDASTSVSWIGRFEAKGVPDDKAIQIASGIYKGGIDGARRQVET